MFRAPSDARSKFRAHPRRVLVITTVKSEGRAVKAHLSSIEVLVGDKGAYYEMGEYVEPAGNWLVVHALSAQGNSDAGLVASKAHQEFGSFNLQIFVGVAGSLKEDIPIGSVVVGDYVYNSHSAKVTDDATLARPHGLAPRRDLLVAAQGLIYTDEWRALIRAPHGMELPSPEKYPCDFPPQAVIKGIASGEEVVAGGKSQRYIWLRTHFNNCGAVEMEGWGAMNAAHHENTAAIVIRGVSDMCAGKDHAKDALHQPIAAAHAAAFAFALLSFQSKIPSERSSSSGAIAEGESVPAIPEATAEDRIEFVFNFDGPRSAWPQERVDKVVTSLKKAINDEDLKLLRIDVGSVRLVVGVRKRDLGLIDIARLRDAVASVGVTLLGAVPQHDIAKAEIAKAELAKASEGLLAWERTLPNGNWIERPERQVITSKFGTDASTTVLLGQPGSGKSALLSRLASDLLASGAPVLAIKADYLPTEVAREADLQVALGLPSAPSDLIARLAKLQPVYLLIDQLDALASQIDLKSGRLNVLLNLIRKVGGVSNVHIVLSARTFEFNHDVRLRAVRAEEISLSLPPWHEVHAALLQAGIESGAWPEAAREVVRSPQALKTYLLISSSAKSAPFQTYQSMLEQLWQERISLSSDGEALATLASDIATKMAEEEALWLAASRYDTRAALLDRLEALAFVVRSENRLSVAFSHQTIFDYVLARTFVRASKLLSKYVLERQDSLFVRAKLWSALNYLRVAEPTSYERELNELWSTQGLRKHLSYLLIEFLGQVQQPSAFEKQLLSGVMNSEQLRLLGLKAIVGNRDWFIYFAASSISEAMRSIGAELGYALQNLIAALRSEERLVVDLIRERWAPDAEKDGYTWAALSEAQPLSLDSENLLLKVLARTPVSIWQVERLALAVGVAQPDVALRLVRSKLSYQLAKAQGDVIDDSSAQVDASSFREKKLSERLESLLESSDWYELPTMAEEWPQLFISILWPWYKTLFAGILSGHTGEGSEYIFPGQYFLEFDFSREETRTHREEPLLKALKIAIELIASADREAFVKWVAENSDFDALLVQQLIAHGFASSASSLHSDALKWLLNDTRRFQLGTRYGHRQSTIALVQAVAPHWSKADVAQFESAVVAYKPNTPSHLSEPDQRKTFLDIVRATKKELLAAIGNERISADGKELVETEQRALGNRFDRTIGEVTGGFIGSPMEAARMARAKDREILNIFAEIPDSADWSHPTKWMQGGNIQLSRAFAEFAQANPERAVRIIDQFQPELQERASGYALEALASEPANDRLVATKFLELNSRGFSSREFRESASRAIEKVSHRASQVNDEIVGVLEIWLEDVPNGDEELEEMSSKESKEQDGAAESILWGYGNSYFLPGGSHNIWSALAAILLGAGESGRDRFISILDKHLSREQNERIWAALLRLLVNSGGTTPEVVSHFLRKLFAAKPRILETKEAVWLIAHAQRWDENLVLDVVRKWKQSESAFLQSAYGEVVGLTAIVKAGEKWESLSSEIVLTGSEKMRIGLAHAAVNLWSDVSLRGRARRWITKLLDTPSKQLASAVVDVFRMNDVFGADRDTHELLTALASDQVDLSDASPDFVVERLQSILPSDASLIAKLTAKLVDAWRNQLANVQSKVSGVAASITDIALTLHRLGGESRAVGLKLFEELLEIDAYGARDTLIEIDGRLSSSLAPNRPRIARRRGRRAHKSP